MSSTDIQSEEWYSWVPTNLGELNIRFFGKSRDMDRNLQNAKIKNNIFSATSIDISFISDTHYFLSKWLNPLAKATLPALEEELFGTTDIVIEETETCFSGTIKLYYSEVFQAVAFFELEHNGKIKIHKLSINPEDEKLWKNFSDKSEFLDYLVQVIFIIIKNIVHGDNHHHQKIDTAIVVKRGKFDPCFILKTMIRHIKRIEHDVKNMNKCHGRLKAQNTIEELNGYRSYIRTFRSLFLKNNVNMTGEPLFVKDPSILDNIIDSAEATVKKRINSPVLFSSFLSIVLVYAAISISGAIMYINLMGKNYQPLICNDWSYYSLGLFILLALMYSQIICSIRSWLFHKYYAFFEYLYYLSSYENPKRWRDKIIKFALIYNKALFFLFVALLSYIAVS